MAEENLQNLQNENDVLRGTVESLLKENLKHQIRDALIAEGATRSNPSLRVFFMHTI